MGLCPKALSIFLTRPPGSDQFYYYCLGPKSLILFKASYFTFKIRNFPNQQCVQKATYLISLPLGKTELKATQRPRVGREGWGGLSLLPLCLTGIPPPNMANALVFQGLIRATQGPEER